MEIVKVEHGIIHVAEEAMNLLHDFQVKKAEMEMKKGLKKPKGFFQRQKLNSKNSASFRVEISFCLDEISILKNDTKCKNIVLL